MTENKEITQGSEKKGEDWPLPHCTKAPVAEHSRSADDEPCDDSRGTIIEQEKDRK